MDERFPKLTSDGTAGSSVSNEPVSEADLGWAEADFGSSETDFGSAEADFGSADTPQPLGGNYAVTRHNALKHGVLSQVTVLPWEDSAEYWTLLEALVAEHKPQAPIEEHLVEELAGIIWRKRRLRLGESAVHHRALAKSTDSSGATAEAALVRVTADPNPASVSNAITATEAETAADLAELKRDQANANYVISLLGGKSPIVYSRAVAALGNIRKSWEAQLAWQTEDYDEGVEPFRADAASLKQYLEEVILPLCERHLRELNCRPLIRAQAFGEAVDLHELERLARYEVHLDRKLERFLTILIRLKGLRDAGGPL
jgi:hypothetical protein